MRRYDYNKNATRNSDFVYNRHADPVSTGNIMAPDVFIDQFWLDTDEVTPRVQIIELKSDGSEKSDQETKQRRTDSNWSYSREHLRHKEDPHDTERAPHKRHVEVETDTEHDYFRRLDHEYEREHDNERYSFYADFYSGDTNEFTDNVVLNKHMNCFTILNKHFDINSDSSDEDYDNDLMNETGSDSWNHSGRHDADILTYDPENEKRTVWIYSFKNKRLLSDKEFELVNIPSQGTTSTNSIDDLEKPKVENSSIRRAATPIPSSFVPRLNLPHTPTLPTVTEVTEPKASSSNNTDKSIRENIVVKKPMNTWFLSEHATPKSEMSLGKSKSVVNWMALSPRDKKRRLKNISPKTKSEPDLCKKKINTFTEELKKPELCDKESQTFEVKAVIETPKHSYKRDIYSARASVGVSCNLTSGRTRISDSIESYTEDEQSPQDRGDHNRSRRRIPRNLKIRFSPKPVGSVISGPIENLDSNWIGEEKAVQTNALSDIFRRQGEDMPETLLIRNMSLLKPAEWASYLPIADSLPSLQLSMNTDSVDGPRPWYSRMSRYIFKCCQ